MKLTSAPGKQSAIFISLDTPSKIALLRLSPGKHLTQHLWNSLHFSIVSQKLLELQERNQRTESSEKERNAPDAEELTTLTTAMQKLTLTAPNSNDDAEEEM
jgi:hypothetical protein